MAKIERRKALQLELATGVRQSTLFQFTPEGTKMLEQRGLVAPPPPPGPREVKPKATIELPGTLEPAPVDLQGARTIPPSVTAGWHLPLPLRDYQLEGYHALLAQHKGSAYLPPGAGKTLLAIAAIERLRVPTIIIVPTLVLVSQWSRVLATAGIPAGVYSGEEKRPSWVTMSTYQSLYQFPEIIRRFPFIVFDETDLVTAEDFQRLLQESDHHPYVLAMTGTKPHQDARIQMLEERLPTLIHRTLQQVGEAGHVIIPEIHRMPVHLTSEESDEYEKIEKAMRAAAAQIRGGPEQASSIIARSRDPDLRQAALRYLAAYNRRLNLVAFAQNKGKAVIEVVRSHPGQKILLFGTRIEALDAACIHLGQAGITCRVLSGETPQQEREDVLENWGKTFQVLGSAKVLERGFNVPEASIAIIMASGSSAQQILQRFGRIARPAPGKDRADAYVVYARGTFEESLPKRMGEVIEKGE
jgi:superfamily II DNA or RNA helicase